VNAPPITGLRLNNQVAHRLAGAIVFTRPRLSNAKGIGLDVADAFNVYGYSVTATLLQVLKQCGDDLTRENVMKQAAHLEFNAPMLLPGVAVHTVPTDFFPIRQMQLAKFDGKVWQRFGQVMAMK
jgi:hypothetical protein